MAPRARALSALLLLVLWLATGSAHAHHALLVRSTPGDGARLDALPTHVQAQFNQRLVAAGSGLKVHDSGGRRVDIEPREISADQTTLSAALPGTLEPGTYVVTWGVTAEADQDFAEGTFTFEVLPGAGQQSPLSSIQGIALTGLGVALVALLVVGAARLPLRNVGHASSRVQHDRRARPLGDRRRNP